MIAIRICTAVVALALSGWVPAAAQVGSLFGPRDRETLRSHRPSMEAVVRCNKTMKALATAAERDSRLKAELKDSNADEEDTESSIDEMGSRLEKSAPLAAAFLARNGCAIRDYVLTVSQFMLVTASLASPVFAKEIDFLPPETVAFWQKNAAAAARLLDEAGTVIDKFQGGESKTGQ